MKVLVLVLVAAALAAPAAAAPSATTLRLKATGVALKFDKKTLTARPGKVTIVFTNLSILRHNVALKGNGVRIKGKVVGKGGTSSVTAKLRRGSYEFYCSVAGHEAGGMKGTLTVK